MRLVAEHLAYWIGCLPFTQGVEGSSPTSSTCPNDFSDPVNQDTSTQCALTWKIVVSEWRSVIAVSLNIGGGVLLLKPAKLYMCTQTHYKHDEDGRTAPGLWGHGSVPLSQTGNIVTRIGLNTHTNKSMKDQIPSWREGAVEYNY